MVNQYLSVGEVAKRSDVNISTLHFYEEKKLISSIRNSANQRQYSRDVLRRIAVIKAAKKIGLTLTEIKDALSIVPYGKVLNNKDWQKLANRWHLILNQRIKNLEMLKSSLTSCIGCGCLSSAVPAKCDSACK